MIDIYFGLPGSGKTTLAVKLAHEYFRNNRPVFADLSVCPIKGVYNIDVSLLGVITPPPNSLLIIDEASIQFNNRAYKNLDKNIISWLKLARHYCVDVVVFSQSFDDMDITIRRLAVRLWHIRRCGCFSLVRRIDKSVGIDENTKQIIDKYSFAPFLSKLLRLPLLRSLFCSITPWYFVFRPFYYRYFDSFVVPSLPYPKGYVYVESKPKKKRFFSFVQRVCRWCVGKN